jgi:hypothetical protein
LIFLGIATLVLGLQDIYQSKGELEIKNVVLYPQTEHKLYEPLEVRFDLSGRWDNPFDPNQLNLSAFVSTDRTYALVPAVLVQDYEFRLENEKEISAKKGNLYWRLNFAPWQLGTFTIDISVTDMVTNTSHRSIKIKAFSSNVKGFSNIPRNSSYFHQGNNCVFISGVTLSEFGEKGTQGIDEKFKELREAGVTVCRVLLSPTNFGIEWMPSDSNRQFAGLGYYNLENAAKLERILQSAQENDISIILCLMSEQEFSTRWNENPYNKAKGGPCETPEEFWTSLRARIQYKRQLRYLIGRYQRYSSLIGFQMTNGVEVPIYWLQEMGNEIQNFHAFGLPMSSMPLPKEAFELRQLRFISKSINIKSSVPEMINEMASLMPDEKAAEKKPVILYANQSQLSASEARTMLWAGTAMGFGGVMFSERASSDKEWHKSVFQTFQNETTHLFNSKTQPVRSVTKSDSEKTVWILRNDKCGIVFLHNESEGGSAGLLSFPVAKSGDYRIKVFDLETNEIVSENKVSTRINSLSFSYPRTKKTLAFSFILE